MNKKLISTLLISTLLLSAGCSASKTIEKTTTEKITETTIVEKETEKENPTVILPKVQNPIYINMDGMTDEDKIKNIWNITDVSKGMSREDYMKKFVMSDSDISTESENVFYWEFKPIASKQYISYIDISVETDNEGKIAIIDENSKITIVIENDSNETASKFFEEIVASYIDAGFDVSASESGKVKDSKIIKVTFNNEVYVLSVTGTTIKLTFPIIETKDGYEIDGDFFNEEGNVMETVSYILEDGKPSANPSKTPHPVKKG